MECKDQIISESKEQIFHRYPGWKMYLDNWIINISRQLEITVPFIFFGYQSQVDDTELDLDSSSLTESRGDGSS